ncbi:hypothetical protein STEG23_010954 [Scotinomys teguina]
MSRSRHVGKIRKRLEDVKNQWIRPARADFSDNESARLATDALLDGGPEAYWHALSQEGEVDFLSSVEAQYIQAQAKEPPSAPDPAGGAEAGSRGLDSCSLQSGTYFPVASEGSEPALFHTWTLAEKPYLKEKSSATVYFQMDKHNNIRDLVRRCISRASQVLAILMDVFTDVEIFCDILEAANKRGVFVCVLLDQGGVKLFQEMCDKVQISDIHLKNISIRSVEGEVYCAKSGRKFAGQIQEKFIISDWRFVLSGSYRKVQAPMGVNQARHIKLSFSWLCGHVHRNILSKFTGQAVELFDEEFRRLYASSKPVMGLRSPRLVAPLRPSKGPGTPNGRLSGSSGSTSDHTSSNPFSNLSTHSNPLNQSMSTSSGPGSPLAPIPPAVPRLQPYHSPRRTVAPQALLVPMRSHEGAPTPYSSFMAYRPTRLQLQQLGLVPRVLCKVIKAMVDITGFGVVQRCSTDVFSPQPLIPYDLHNTFQLNDSWPAGRTPSEAELTQNMQAIDSVYILRHTLLVFYFEEHSACSHHLSLVGSEEYFVSKSSVKNLAQIESDNSL